MAAGQTMVEYGEVRIFNCHTRQFTEEAVFDDSDTDLVYHRFLIRVTGIMQGISAGEINSVGITPTPASDDPAFHHDRVRKELIPPRQRFEMRLGADGDGNGGTVLIAAERFTAEGSTFNADVNNGPKCRRFEIVNVVANNLLEVQAEFEICLRECGDSGGRLSTDRNVISNRWTVSDDINEEFYTTRTFTGRLITASTHVNPNEFRRWCLPPLQPGMQRWRMNFTVGPDGKSLDYTITDKEVAWSAPAPATSWHFSHTESVAEDGATMYRDVSVTLGGDRNVDKKVLLRLAASIIRVKTVIFPNDRAEAARILSIAFSDEYGNDQKNIVRAYARAQHLIVGQDANPNQRINTATGALGTPIGPQHVNFGGYDSNLSRGGRPGENLEIKGPIPMKGAITALVREACSGNFCLSDGKTVDGERSCGSEDLPQVNFRRSAEPLPDVPAYMSSENLRGLYTFWQMESRYDTDSMDVQLPISRSQSPRIASTSVLNQASSAIVRLAEPQARRIVRVKAERLADYPAIPSGENYIDSNGIRGFCLKRHVQPHTPTRSAGGERVYRVDVECQFALSRAPRPGETLPVGANPWETLGLAVFREHQGNLRIL